MPFAGGMLRSLACGFVTSLIALQTTAWAATLNVGPGKSYAMPCAAFADALDGDVIEIDSAGNYDGNVCAVTQNQLTIRGVGTTRARIDANGASAMGKAIWVVQGNDTVIENIEFSGAAVPDMNGAGIRQEGKNLTVRNCAFRDNEDGILAGDMPGSEILIEYSEFDHNGAGDGYSHNLYINHVAKLTFQFNYSHSAVIGHLLKSRAAENHILYNRLSGEADGTQSYEIDIPNGGKTYVIGNVLEQGANTDNPNMLSYLAEGANANNPSMELFVINNTFANHLGKGTFINLGAAATVPAVIRNNVFYGGGTVCSQSNALVLNNLEGGAECFVNEAAFDYRLREGSACVDAGADPGTDADFSLAPTAQYLHPTQREGRPRDETLDLGAYELGEPTVVGTGGAPTVVGAGGAPTVVGTGGASSSTVVADPAAATDGGCGCRVGRRSPQPLSLGAVALFAWRLLLRRRGHCKALIGRRVTR